MRTSSDIDKLAETMLNVNVSNSPARRVPVQARSRKRYDAILEAATELFATEGFDATTVDQVAINAETSIGSVYQFFDGKEHIFQTVVERLFESVRELFDGLHLEPWPADWRTLTGATVDAFLGFTINNTACRAVLRNLDVFKRHQHIEWELDKQLQATSDRVLAHYGPKLSEKRRNAIAKALHQIIGMTSFLYSVDPSYQDEGTKAEIKVMIERYLAAEFAAAEANE